MAMVQAIMFRDSWAPNIRNRHSRSAMRSRLEGIPGLGEVRRKKLLQQFGTVKAVTQAELPELEAALPKAVALAVYERFHGVEDK